MVFLLSSVRNIRKKRVLWFGYISLIRRILLSNGRVCVLSERFYSILHNWIFVFHTHMLKSIWICFLFLFLWSVFHTWIGDFVHDYNSDGFTGSDYVLAELHLTFFFFHSRASNCKKTLHFLANRHPLVMRKHREKRGKKMRKIERFLPTVQQINEYKKPPSTKPVLNHTIAWVLYRFTVLALLFNAHIDQTDLEMLDSHLCDFIYYTVHIHNTYIRSTAEPKNSLKENHFNLRDLHFIQTIYNYRFTEEKSIIYSLSVYLVNMRYRIISNNRVLVPISDTDHWLITISVLKAFKF